MINPSASDVVKKAMHYQSRFLLGLLFVSILIFSCREDDEGQGPLEGNGNITFYINEPMPCNEIQITFYGSGNNEVQGRLRGDRIFDGVPECSEMPSMSFMNRSYGSYSYTVECGSLSFGGDLMLNTPCHTIKIEAP
ncbi:hypothetical protein [Pleomorphovibrio marinus]|uniref:hypothetical protein n=1 Tax=Pleomorphovibrio marinus TaxID=2164132 RepID=UPI000E0AF1E7|nr:hypothetical protein [Pleomorphovibrio marinus]